MLFQILVSIEQSNNMKKRGVGIHLTQWLGTVMFGHEFISYSIYKCLMLTFIYCKK